MKADCPKAEKCLHWLTYSQHKVQRCLTVIDLRRQDLGAGCPDFLVAERVHMARGFRSAYAQIPKGYTTSFRDYLRQQMGWGMTYFYEACNGKRRLTPSQQSRIEMVFRRFAVERADYFDSYEEGYLQE